MSETINRYFKKGYSKDYEQSFNAIFNPRDNTPTLIEPGIYYTGKRSVHNILTGGTEVALWKDRTDDHSIKIRIEILENE